MMKQVILCVLCTIMTLSSFAQELKLSSEDEIFDKQMSQNYFYGECTETYDSTAMANAWTDLISNVKRSDSTLLIIRKDVKYYYYTSEIGGIKYLHVYAFVEKNKYQHRGSVAKPAASDGAEVTMPTSSQQQKEVPIENNLVSSVSRSVTPNNTNNKVRIHIEEIKWKKDAIEYLIKSEDLPSAVECLERMIVTKKIAEYGRYQDCKDKANVCWAVFDSQNRVIAILGDGAQYRYNYKTNKTDELEHYIKPSYKVLWFSFDD